MLCCAVQRLCVHFFFCVCVVLLYVSRVCGDRACEVRACITHACTCARVSMHAADAAYISCKRVYYVCVCSIVSVCGCACAPDCARSQGLWPMACMCECVLARTCVVCVCVQYCTAQCWSAPCCAILVLVHAACAARALRVMRARGASARVRGLAIPVAGNVCAALSPRSLGSARPMLLQFVEDVEEDVEGFI